MQNFFTALVGSIGLAFVVVVNVELAASNDYATPELGACFESARDGKGTAVGSRDTQREQAGNCIVLL